MRSLSDTIARLGALRQAHERGARPAVADRLRDLDDFGSNPGALRARMFVPSDLAPGSPLVVVLHGCTQSAAEYDHGSGWSDLAERDGFALLFAEQRSANNPNLCFNWFQPGDSHRDSGEALSIRQMIEAMAVQHAIDPARIFVTGLSAGGAMASILLATYPEIFAGGAILSGLPYGVANTIPEAFDRMRGHGLPEAAVLQERVRSASPTGKKWPTISVWHGTADATVSVRNAAAIVEQWSGLHDVQGEEASHLAGHARTVWRDRSGRECIEQILIAGMGHGTPIATAGPDACGAAGPYMLDVGLSSTAHLARTWGLMKSGTPKRVGRPLPKPDEAPAAPRTGVTPLPSFASAAQGVQKTIEDALRSAGLMK